MRLFSGSNSDTLIYSPPATRCISGGDTLFNPLTIHQVTVEIKKRFLQISLFC